MVSAQLSKLTLLVPTPWPAFRVSVPALARPLMVPPAVRLTPSPVVVLMLSRLPAAFAVMSPLPAASAAVRLEPAPVVVTTMLPLLLVAVTLLVAVASRSMVPPWLVSVALPPPVSRYMSLPVPSTLAVSVPVGLILKRELTSEPISSASIVALPVTARVPPPDSLPPTSRVAPSLAPSVAACTRSPPVVSEMAPAFSVIPLFSASLPATSSVRLLPELVSISVGSITSPASTASMSPLAVLSEMVPAVPDCLT